MLSMRNEVRAKNRMDEYADVLVVFGLSRLLQL